MRETLSVYINGLIARTVLIIFSNLFSDQANKINQQTLICF